MRNLFLVLLFILIGCVGPQNSHNQTKYSVRPFTIIVVEESDMNSYSTNYFNFAVYGFYDMKKRIIYVPYGKETNQFNGNKLPDFYVLGHEILHLQEVEGNWHK